MEYQIEGAPLPVVICQLEAGETMLTERGSMSWMTPNMKMETSTNGGLGKAFGRMLSGDSIFQNRYTAQGGQGLIAFASSFPGSIRAFDIGPGRELVVQKSTANGLMLRQGDMSVTCQINNYIIYQEVVVTAVDTVHVPIDLSFVKFPNTIDLTTSSTAVVQNGDEFVRNMDIAADFVKYLDQRFGISTSEAFVRVKEVIGKLTTFLQGKG